MKNCCQCKFLMHYFFCGYDIYACHKWKGKLPPYGAEPCEDFVERENDYDNMCST